MISPTPCSLEAMLVARDKRRQRQAGFFARNEHHTLIIATVVAPGVYKVTDETLIVAQAQRAALHELFAPDTISEEYLDPLSGHETWLEVSLPPDQAKRMAVMLEDTHPLGRLFDIDVIRPDLTPISRTELGLPSRSCLLCDQDARVCMRNRTHTPNQVADYISHIVNNYLQIVAANG